MIKRGPFGLEMGMRPEELIGDFEEVKAGLYVGTAVPKPHPAFASYGLTFSENYGLHAITAQTDVIHTSVYGAEISGRFYELKGKLEKAYGNCESYDFLMHDSIWNEPRDWMQGLLRRDRSLAALWEDKYGSTLDNQLQSIFLNTYASSSDEGFISLAYTFLNNSAAIEEREELEDDAL